MKTLPGRAFWPRRWRERCSSSVFSNSVSYSSSSWRMLSRRRWHSCSALNTSSAERPARTCTLAGCLKQADRLTGETPVWRITRSSTLRTPCVLFPIRSGLSHRLPRAVARVWVSTAPLSMPPGVLIELADTAHAHLAQLQDLHSTLPCRCMPAQQRLSPERFSGYVFLCKLSNSPGPGRRMQ